MKKFIKLANELLNQGFTTKTDLKTIPTSLQELLAFSKVGFTKTIDTGIMFVTLNNELFVDKDLDMITLGFKPINEEYQYVTEEPLSGHCDIDDINAEFDQYFNQSL